MIKLIRNIFFTTVILSSLSAHILYSQDTSKSNQKSVLKTVQDTSNINRFIHSSHFYLYLNRINADTITRTRFLWLPLKSFEDIFNYLPGYNMKFMDVGQIGQLNYNQLDQNYTGVFRNGRPINDLFDGTIDFNLLSKNEVSDIELTNGFGNFLYNYNNGINIINKQIFQYRPYSEISYWQDRYENLYLDGNYHQNIFRNFNFNFGITKHSYDGRYTNSDFDIWQGRFNLNYAPSSNVNMFLYSNYSKIQRGLNGGIDPLRTNVTNNDSLANILAIVRNPNSRDVRERFDVDFGIVYSGKNSFTKFQLYTSNSFRLYNDSTQLRENTHWIDYGVKVQQIFNFKPSKNANLGSRTEAEYDRDLLNSPLSTLRQSARYFFLQDLSLNYNGLTLNGFGKAYRYDYYNTNFYFDYGAKADYRLKIDSANYLGFYGQYSSLTKLPTYLQKFLNDIYPVFYGDKRENINSITVGTRTLYKNLNLDINYNHSSIKGYLHNVMQGQGGIYFLAPEPGQDIIYHNNLNAKLGAKVQQFELELDGSYTLKAYDTPRYFGNAMLSYHNLFFKNKLEVKIGITSRFWDDYSPVFYNGRFNQFSDRVTDTIYVKYDNIQVKRNVTLDFFVIGKINKAIFGLTLENILNKVLYTTAFYPYQDRGGLANIISRFNITWYFLN